MPRRVCAGCDLHAGPALCCYVRHLDIYFSLHFVLWLLGDHRRCSEVAVIVGVFVGESEEFGLFRVQGQVPGLAPVDQPADVGL